MPKPQVPRRHSRDRVVVVRCSEVSAHFLVADITAQRRAADAWRTVRVEIDVELIINNNLRGSDVGDGAAKTMANDDQSVGWIGGSSGVEGGEDAGAGFEPAVVAMVTFSFCISKLCSYNWSRDPDGNGEELNVQSLMAEA